MFTLPDADTCYRAVTGRDPRYDGWIYVGITSTGIYCRPSCPARTPLQANCRFFPAPGAAQQAGFRACRRCRPDAVPGSPQWNPRADVVGRTMRLIADGLVDRSGVTGLADAVGYSERQLNRLLVAEVGAGPLALARAQRAQTARALIENTELPMTDIAFAAGFASVRQFNDTVREVYGRAPSTLRPHRARTPTGAARPPAVTLKLPVRKPYAGRPIFTFLATRAVAGVEAAWIDDQFHYRRSCALPHGTGLIELIMDPQTSALSAVLELDDLRDLSTAVSRIRRLLDLDADPVAIDGVLSAEPLLAGSVAATPGVRLPGVLDSTELAFRAVIGQQVSVAGAATTAAKITARYGRQLHHDRPGEDRLRPNEPTHLFPGAEALAEADPDQLPMPRSRGRSLISLARALADGQIDLCLGADRHEARARLLELPGIGAWTAGYIALRALGDPDILLTEDLIIRRELLRHGIGPRGRPEWAPWRSYATMRLWHASASDRDDPTPTEELLTA